MSRVLALLSVIPVIFISLFLFIVSINWYFTVADRAERYHCERYMAEGRK
jgi:hypothetical protein